MSRAPGPIAANLICVASMLMWSAGLPASHYLIPLLPPLPLSGARMTLAALTLLPLWLLIEGFGAVRGANWLRGIGVGSLIGLGGLLLVMGQTRTDAVTLAVITTAMPVIGIALEVVFDGRKLTLPVVAGILLALIGSLVAMGTNLRGPSFGFGALICFASVLVFTLGSRLTVTALPTLSPLGRTAVTLTGAAIATVIATTLHVSLGGAVPDFAAIGGRGLAALLFFAVIGLAIHQLLWIIAVSHLGIAVASLHVNATPFYVMAIFFALGAPWNWTQALGAAIVGLGVLVAQGIIPLARRAATQ